MFLGCFWVVSVIPQAAVDLGSGCGRTRVRCQSPSRSFDEPRATKVRALAAVRSGRDEGHENGKDTDMGG